MTGVAGWEQRFTRSRIVAARVAPADRGAGLVTTAGRDGLRLHAWDVATGRTRPVPTPAANLLLACWLGHDARYAYVLADAAGNEFGHLTAVDLRDGRPPVDLTPTLDPYPVRGVGVSPGGAGLVVDAVTAAGFRIYYLAGLAAPEPRPRLLASYQHEAWNCLLSADGTIATVDVTDHNPGQRRFAVQALAVPGGEPLARLADRPGSSVEGRLFARRAGDPSMVVTTDRSGVRRPVVWHIADDRRRELAVDDLPGDVIPLDWSGDGRYLLLCHSWRAAQLLLRYDLDTDRAEPLAVAPGSYHDDLLYSSHFGPAGSILVAVETMTTPLAVLRHDPAAPAAAAGTAAPAGPAAAAEPVTPAGTAAVVGAKPGAGNAVVLASEPVPPGRPARSVDFRSSDGTLAQGWLATPPGPGPHPTVIHLHGGPHWVERDAYHPTTPMWLDHGYAYLGLNFRGSTSFGTEYQQAIWGRLGQLELEDLRAARQWLLEHGVARSGQLLLTGVSYGGFLTLYALSRQPALWAGGIGELVIADWTTAYRDANPATRRALANWHGGTPEQVPQRYRNSSPRTYLADLTAPLLIRQARGDSRTPSAQVEEYEQAARQLGKPVTVHWNEGGHAPLAADPVGFPRLMLSFASDCLAGQRSGWPDGQRPPDSQRSG